MYVTHSTYNSHMREINIIIFNYFSTSEYQRNNIIINLLYVFSAIRIILVFCLIYRIGEIFELQVLRVRNWLYVGYFSYLKDVRH